MAVQKQRNPTLWNSLPENLRLSVNLDVFKKSLRHIFTNRHITNELDELLLLSAFNYVNLTQILMLLFKFLCILIVKIDGKYFVL